MCMPLWTVCPSFVHYRLYHKLFKEACVASYVEKRNDDSNKHLDNCNEEECSPECYVFDCSNVSEDTVEIECAPASDVNGSGTSGKPAEGATLEEEWMEIFEDLKKKMREDPVSFRPAVASFVSNFKKMQTD
ncbi:uncharacterized protein si:dkey-75a21.2 [Coregonus clupeaformis]|uniref:uncharacterized protein si:dkey-75a21.2 n=1 Tax=Coregonus clupeaformis TaxID=59861 RepID=UPI001E1C8279|nr:uncharacterized protein si:dkey-75a21.2 [Coregonus clupeaformis]